MQTPIGATVYIKERNGGWVHLRGYAGGLAFGMTSGKDALNDTDDGIDRAIKGNASGAESAIVCYYVDGDPGQALARSLASPYSTGEGGARIVYPDGTSISADGLFTGIADNPADPDAYRGFVLSFTQIEPETRT